MGGSRDPNGRRLREIVNPSVLDARPKQLIGLPTDNRHRGETMKTTAAAILACLLTLNGAAANDPVAHDVKIVPYSKNGEQTGCAIEYRMAFIDEVTATLPSPLFAVGTLGWMESRDGMPFGILKIKATIPQGSSTVPVKVTGGSVRVGQSFYQVDTTIRCEESGSFCGAFSTDKAMSLMTAVLEGATFINVLRAGSSRDLPVRMPFSISNSAELGSCMKPWLEKLARN